MIGRQNKTEKTKKVKKEEEKRGVKMKENKKNF